MVTRDRHISLIGLALLLGAYSLLVCRQLPGTILLVPCALLGVVLFACRRTRYAGAFSLGFAVIWLAAIDNLGDRLEPVLAGQDINLLGRVAEFPQQASGSIRFVFEPLDRADLPQRIRLGWYTTEFYPQPGETWHLRVRLRRPRGLANPDGFDFNGWLFRQGIGATGYVLETGDNRRLLARQADIVSRIRQRIVGRISALLPDDDASAVLMAIGVGARHKITRAAWDAYAASGTTHLMAISGLHIGLAAGSFFMLAWALLGPVCQRNNVRDVAIMLAIVAAGVYAEVSGFAVPARRAFLMALLLAAALLLRRRLSKTGVFAISAMLVFLSDPVAILTPGFMMSFAAVALLQIVVSRFSRQDELAGSTTLGRAVATIRGLSLLQWALLGGLFPMSVLLFDRFAIAAPLVNLLVLPVFNFVTVPFCLFGMLLDGPLQDAGDALLWCSYQSIRLVLALVAKVAAQPWIQFETSQFSPFMVITACIPCIVAVLPAGWPGRRIAVLSIVAIIVFKPSSPSPGCLEYTVLDVGQGLASILRTARHTLVFDTGPAYRGGNDVAQLVVLPFLRSQGVRRVDKLIVSHSDLDHAGGLHSLLAKIEVREILLGEEVDNLWRQSRPCRAGSSWVWDGVRFDIVHPHNRSAWDGNNLSCVLRASVAKHQVLFTGDIEAPVEILLAYRTMLAPATVVVVPHHGSGTSSSTALVQAVRPNLAIVSAGFANRWGMPKDAVVRRWQAGGAQVVNTAYAGAISQKLCAGEEAGRVRQTRDDARRFWHDLAEAVP